MSTRRRFGGGIYFLACPAANRFVIQWSSVDGKTCSLLRSTNIVGGSGWQPVASGLGAVPPLNTYTDQFNGGSVFYRIRKD